MSQQTFIKPDDIITTLQSYQLVQYWKGQVRGHGTRAHLRRGETCARAFQPDPPDSYVR